MMQLTDNKNIKILRVIKNLKNRLLKFLMKRFVILETLSNEILKDNNVLSIPI